MNLSKVKIKSKRFLKETETVYDVQVKDAHHYLLESGIVSHNSIGGYIPTINIKGGNAGIYNCSIILTLTKANLKSDKQMDGKETDALAEKNNIANRMGIIATSRPFKNRFAKPIPIKFHISFFRGMNPFVGLENYISWEACGIQRGTYEEVIEEKPVLNEKGEQVIYRNKPKVEKINTGKFIFVADESAKGWAVKHLNREVLPHEFFSNAVFTEDVLKQLDENVIKPLFELPEIYDYDDDIVNELGLENFSDDNTDSLEGPMIAPINITEI